MATTPNNTDDRELKFTRVLKFPRELVFSAWTDPKHLINWWGPRGFHNTFKESTIKPGGKWTFTMHGPDGTDFPNQIIYKEIIKNEFISFDYGSGEPNDPQQFFVTVNFSDQGKNTEITMKMVFASKAIRDEMMSANGANEGNKQTFDKLEEELLKITSNVFSVQREFSAPLELVWKAFTHADQLKQWWGPKGSTVIHSKMDLRPDGIFHYALQGPDGSEMWAKFTYRDIVPNKKLVYVSSFSDKNGTTQPSPFPIPFPLEVLNTASFLEKNGKTTVIISGFPINATEEQLKTFDSLHESMNGGFNGTFDQLEEFLSNK
ncbi:MAG: hypothetical protein K0S32_1531 [Bacteroidetes bacterium]|jgi:uncharacterized protein YndB with AHSA1/START domain|nr:hypothetical protein [Bacteroidota bacterium]